MWRVDLAGGGVSTRMDLRRAVTYVFNDPRWPMKLGRAATFAWLPIVGQLLLGAYALRTIRAAATDDRAFGLPELSWNGSLLLTGLKCQILTIVCGLAAGLLTLPLWALTAGETRTTDETTNPPPALVSALHGPTYLLATSLMALFTALCLARFATTGSAWAALDVSAIWSFLRAEPIVWIATAVVGFTIAETPATVAWLLPLPASWQVPALLIATALFWPFALLIQAHLIGQAHRWSAMTLARHRPLIVRVRW